jgi:hypothetical protein
MEALTLLTVGALNIACFFIGAKLGQKVAKDEPIETPNLNPVQMIQAHREKKQAEREKKRIDIIMANIDAYDGTSKGQQEVPRG